MKADVQYNDFKGTTAADVSDGLSKNAGDNLKSIGQYFGLDENRFEIVGLSIYGTDDFIISMLCIDKERSKDGNEHLVDMMYDGSDDKGSLDVLFKRLHIVLYSRFDDTYPDTEKYEEVRFSDFHDKANDEEEEYEIDDEE